MSKKANNRGDLPLQVVVVLTSSQGGDRLRRALELILQAAMISEEQVKTEAIHEDVEGNEE